MSSSINLASGLAPVAEISDSNDEQDASARCNKLREEPNLWLNIHLLVRQDLRQPF